VLGAEDEAFDAFVRTSSTSLLRTAALLAGDAELGRDLLQAALVQALLRWRSIDAPAAYVRRVMATTVIDWKRRRRYAEVPLPDRDLRAAPDPMVVVDNRELALRLLRSLPPAQRVVLTLRFFEDLTEAATAEVLGISVGAVKSATSRGLQALRPRANQEVER